MSDQEAPLTWEPRVSAELLDVESGEVAFVDLANAVNLLDKWRDNPPWPYDPAVKSLIVGDGVTCRTGGDGLFTFTVRGRADACTELQVWCDESEELPDFWMRPTTIDVASGVLLVADPFLIDQYTVEAFDGPVFMSGLWIELRLPAPGHVVVDLGIREDAGQWDAPSVLRARWLPTSHG